MRTGKIGLRAYLKRSSLSALSFHPRHWQIGMVRDAEVDDGDEYMSLWLAGQETMQVFER
jgi:hypothetical protein